MNMKLLHKTVFLCEKTPLVRLPFIDELRRYHPEGEFHLTEHPIKKKCAVILGMFVLRPGVQAWTDQGLKESLYNPMLDWAYNVNSIPGGWLVSNKNAVDAYRLCLHYALADAVITGSNTTAVEGVSTPSMPGYVWQPYNLCQWSQLKNSDPDLLSKMDLQRKSWQDLGILSKRKYPAQIVFTWSGDRHASSPDFLEARIFHDLHPDGTPMEVYILTSERGAESIRARAHLFPTIDMAKVLVIVPPPASSSSSSSSSISSTSSTSEEESSSPTTTVSSSTSTFDSTSTSVLSAEIDIASIPQLLFDRFDMRIVNHDGGHKVLREFCKAGALCQMNITLMRQQSLQSIVETINLPDEMLSETKRASILSNFASEEAAYFFGDDAGTRGIPTSLQAVAIVRDEADETAIVTFDTRKGLRF